MRVRQRFAELNKIVTRTSVPNTSLEENHTS